MFFQFTVLLANSLVTLYVRLTPTPNPSPVKREGLSECVSPSLLYGGKGQGLGGLEVSNTVITRSVHVATFINP